MSDNPYAPPQSGLGTGSRVDENVGGGDFDIGVCLSDAWSNTWSNFPLWLGFGLVWAAAGLASVLTIVGIFLLVPVLTWGAVVFGLHMHDGGAEIGDLFVGFRRYGKVLLNMLVLIILVSVLTGIGQIPMAIGDATGSDLLSGIGFLVYLGWTFLVAPRLFFSYFFVVDRELPPTDAIQASWESTGPVKWKLALLMLLYFALLAAGMLLLIVGVIPAAVIALLTWVSAYRQMMGGPSPA